MENTIISIEHLSKKYQETEIFTDTDFYLREGEKLALVGGNGSGKSSLLRIIAGEEEMDAGQLSVMRNLKIGYLPQLPVFAEGDTVLEAALRREGEAKEKLPEDPKRSAMMRSILNHLELFEEELPVDALSGGQKKRLALARLLLSESDVILLDEPTNHLDSRMTEWLEDYISGFKGAVLLVTHDRYFLDRVCTRILELSHGKLRSFDCDYEGYLEEKAAMLDNAKARERERQSLLRKELAWIRRGAKARTTKQKGRIQRYEKLAAMHGPREEEALKLSSVMSRLGKSTIEIRNLHKSFEGRPVIRDFSYHFKRNDRIGIVGRNGIGKSTLLKLIAGWMEPDLGEIEIGQTVKIGYFSQENEGMEGDRRVLDSLKDIAEYVSTTEGLISASAMLERFLFPPEKQFTMISKLSGGEKRRLYLLRVLMTEPNVLLMDEPSNDLDLETLSVLEDYLDHFTGILVTVSHDRYFLDRTVNRIFAFHENGEVRQYEGGYTELQRKLREEEEGVLHSSRLSGKRDGAASDRSPGASGRGRDSRSGEESSTVLPGTASAGRKSWDRGKRRKKMSYQESREYETIERDIAAWEEKLASLEQEMLENANNFTELNRLTEEKNAVEEELQGKYERWEYLNLLQEEIQGESAALR